MDGIAIASHAATHGRRMFRIAGIVAAGAEPQPLPGVDCCLEVMTGAMLPAGADTVIPVELLGIAGGTATLADAARPATGDNVHRRGTDARAGDLALAAGTRLRGPELAVAASAGRGALQVSPRPRIAIVSTGDELVGPDVPLAPWQIRRSNALGIAATLVAHGYHELEDLHLRDDPADIRSALATALEGRDALVLSGGVSAGRFDHVPAVLASLGVEQVFHKVAQRPGKPLWFGIAPGGKPVFALPGNPVSTLVCLVRYVLAGLARLEGATPPPVLYATLGEDYDARPGLTAFIPVDLDGARVRLHPTHGSGDFTALTGTAGFVELSPGRRHQAGEAVPFYTW
jgi:molybdopterin molybdotransferase